MVVGRTALALTLLVGLAGGARAPSAVASSFLPQAVRAHVASWHDRGDFNDANPGLALRWSSGFVAGGFYNSYRRPSWYGGFAVPVFARHAIEPEVMAGVITGYSDSSPLDVVAVPSLGWRMSPRNSVQVVFMPRFVIPANVVHVMFERRFGDGASDRAH